MHTESKVMMMSNSFDASQATRSEITKREIPMKYFSH
jgi:hypothetical protein